MHIVLYVLAALGLTIAGGVVSSVLFTRQKARRVLKGKVTAITPPQPGGVVVATIATETESVQLEFEPQHIRAVMPEDCRFYPCLGADTAQWIGVEDRIVVKTLEESGPTRHVEELVEVIH